MMSKRLAPVIMVVALSATAILSAEETTVEWGRKTVERGKELFESTRLGTNQKSCATCHPNGKSLQRAASSYDDARLGRIVNLCIRNMLAGRPLPRDSSDLEALVGYVKTFAAP